MIELQPNDQYPNTSTSQYVQHIHQHMVRMQYTQSILDNGTTGEMLLEKILEEEGNLCEERQREYHSIEHEHDKKHLLGNGHMVTVHVTRI